MTIIEELALRLRADGDAQVKAALAGVNNSVDKLAANFGKMLGAYLGFAFWKGIVEGSVRTAIELSKLSEQTGATIEDLSRLRFAADLADVSHEELTTGLRFLTKAMQGVDLETGNAAKSLTMIGVKTRDAAGAQRPLLDVLLEVSDKFNSFADGPAKSALAMNIFGRSGAALIPILNQGSAAIREMFKESDQLGNTMGTQAANQLREYDDAMDRVKGTLSGIAREIAVAVTPSLTTFANKLTTSSDAMETLRIIGKEVLSVFTGIGFILNLVGNTVVYVALQIKEFFGGLAKAAVGVITGDFGAAAAAIEKSWTSMMENDAAAMTIFEEEVAATAKRISEIWNGVAGGPQKKTKPDDKPKPDAPSLTPDDAKEAPEWDTAALRAQYEYQLALAQDDYEAKRALALKWFALMQDLYGRNSSEYYDSLKEIEQLDQEHGDEVLEEQMRVWKAIGDGQRAISNEYNAILEKQKALWSEIAGIAANGIEAAFAAIFAKGGGIGAGLKAFAGVILQGIGGIFTRMGAAAIAASPIVAAIATALKTLSGAGLLAAGVGLVAVGATLGAIGGRIGNAGFAPASGANAYSGVSPATPQSAVRLIFGENSATTAAGMTPRQATNVTIIGPNDPRAQRELQELMNNANRRG